MKILPKDQIKPKLKTLFKNSQKDIKIVSAWIKGEALKELLESVPEDVSIQIIIRASSIDDLLITDDILFKVLEKNKAKIYLNPNLHSKFFIFDNKKAVLGSSNLTFSGLEENGNVETDVLIEEKKQVDEIINVFEETKENSFELDQITGIVLSAENSSLADFLILDESTQENSFVTFQNENKYIISRIATISSIPVNTFYASNGSLVKAVLEKIENLVSIFSSKNNQWEKAAFFGYFNESTHLKVAKLEILGIYDKHSPKEESLLKPLNKPLDVGTIGTINNKIIQKVFDINHAGYKMSLPVKFGKVLNFDIDAKLDFEKISSMHMAVLGTTGSGKTTFVRRMLENIDFDVKVFIFDIYNEYKQSLKESFIVNLPLTIFPITYENLKQLFKENGINFQERTKEEKEVAGFLKRNLKPDINFIGYNKKSLEEIIYDAASLIKEDLLLKAELIYFLEVLESDYGKDAVSNQKEILNLIKNALNTKEKFVIFNFEKLEDLSSKINITGILLKEIFKFSKKNSGRYTVVLEEAQNFAPEKTATDVPASSENLAYTMAKKIAMEGRKFNLGLIAITQRPANISKYVLSQLNTQVILKLVNKNDLDAVSIFFEANKQQVFNSLPYFKPGYLYITGLAVPFGYVSKIKLG